MCFQIVFLLFLHFLYTLLYVKNARCRLCTLSRSSAFLNGLSEYVQGVPPKLVHFCCAVAWPVSMRARRPVFQINRTLQDFRTRGCVTRSDNFGARYKQFSKKVHFLSYFGNNSRVSENFTGKNRQLLIT